MIFAPSSIGQFRRYIEAAWDDVTFDVGVERERMTGTTWIMRSKRARNRLIRDRIPTNP
jgi:hypothetical protein